MEWIPSNALDSLLALTRQQRWRPKLPLHRCLLLIHGLA